MLSFVKLSIEFVLFLMIGSAYAGLGIFLRSFHRNQYSIEPKVREMQTNLLAGVGLLVISITFGVIFLVIRSITPHPCSHRVVLFYNFLFLFIISFFHSSIFAACPDRSTFGALYFFPLYSNTSGRVYTS